MSITLGQLRSYCQEVVSKDANGSTAERDFMNWINNALEKLYMEVALDATRRETKLHVPPVATRADVVATVNSLVFTSATGFLDIWRSERWGVHVEGESQIEFEISTLNGGLTDATMRSGDQWIQASATGLDAYFTKNKFNIPTVAEILQVRMLDGRSIPYVTPELFDTLKQQGPTQRGDTPNYCTYRNDYLEIWPSPGENYYKLSVTYRLGFTPHSSSAAADGGDADATTVVWPDRHLGILKKALMVEGALSMGKNAPVPYPVALAEFTKSIDLLRNLSVKEALPRPIQVQPPITFGRRGRRSLPPRGGEVEQI